MTAQATRPMTSFRLPFHRIRRRCLIAWRDTELRYRIRIAIHKATAELFTGLMALMAVIAFAVLLTLASIEL